MTTYSCIAVSQAGPTKRRNEDALLLNGQVHQGNIRMDELLQRKNGDPLVLAVADGMAGSPYAHFGSRLLLELLAESFRQSPDSQMNLRDRLLALQDTFVEHGRKLKRRGTAATLAGVVITDDQVQVFNVGDSRVYGINGGTVRQLSRDHTELADMIESGEVEPMAVRDAPSSFLEPSSFFMADAIHELGSIYIRTVALDSVEAIIICSDGLLDTINDIEIAAWPNEAYLAQAILETARARGALDDITVQSLRKTKLK